MMISIFQPDKIMKVHSIKKNKKEIEHNSRLKEKKKC